jgi:hypothetical protein
MLLEKDPQELDLAEADLIFRALLITREMPELEARVDRNEDATEAILSNKTLVRDAFSAEKSSHNIGR